MKNWAEYGKKQSYYNLRFYPVSCWEGLGKTTKTFGQYSLCSGRGSNRATHKYKSDAFTLEPYCLVKFSC
jgi:hypothetical protein